MPATLKKGKPYIWVTWICGLLAGEDHCQWAAWFASRHKYEAHVREDPFDLDTWKREHGAMVAARVQALEADGWTVYVEGQNEFLIDGIHAKLAGKPDIVAVRPFQAAIPHGEKLSEHQWLVRVIDCKSGRQRDKDLWQVYLYLFAYSLFEHLGIPKGAVIHGEVEYGQHSFEVPAQTFTTERRQEIIDQIRLTAGDTPPRKVPSAAECRYCDISAEDCPERVAQRATTTTSAF